MLWHDINDIAISLLETYPNIDPLTISFVDLHKYVCQLADFTDNPQSSNEKILEAIQAAWIAEL